MPFYVTDQEDVPRIYYSLWTGAEYGDEACVKCHIENRGVDVNSTDGHGYTALHLAAQHDHVRIVKYLLGRGAVVDSGSWCTPLHRAAYSGSFASCKMLLEAGASVSVVDESFGDLRTPLHKAAARHVDIVLLLIDAGADLEALDRHRRTPLHVAAESGNLDVVDLLLERGADRMAKDVHGHSPAHVAAMNGHQDAMRALVGDSLLLLGEDHLLLHLAGENARGSAPTNPVPAEKSQREETESVVVVVKNSSRRGRRVATCMRGLEAAVDEKRKTAPPPTSRIRLDDEGAAIASSLFKSLRSSDDRRRQLLLNDAR